MRQHLMPEVSSTEITVTKKATVIKLDQQPPVEDNNEQELFIKAPGSQQFWQYTNIGSPAIPKSQIPPYSVFNLSGDYYITRNLRFIGGISNLTDAKYYNRVFANGIEPAPRLSGYAGLSLSF